MTKTLAEMFEETHILDEGRKLDDVKEFLTTAEATIEKRVREAMLEDYTNFLVKTGYCDADVYVEEPKAIDRYLSSLTTKRQ